MSRKSKKLYLHSVIQSYNFKPLDFNIIKVCVTLFQTVDGT